MTTLEIILTITSIVTGLAAIVLFIARDLAKFDLKMSQREVSMINNRLSIAVDDRDEARKHRDKLYKELKVERDDHNNTIDAYVAGMTLMSAVEAARRHGKPTTIKLLRTDYHVLGAPKFPLNVTLEWSGEAPNFHCVDREHVEVVAVTTAKGKR